MSSLWLSLLLAAASWLYIVPEFEPPAPIGWGVMVLGAVAFAVQGLRTTRHPITADAAAVLVVPAAVAAFLIPLPYNIGPVLFMAGCLLGLAAARLSDSDDASVGLRGRLMQLGTGVAFTGVVASVQALVLWPFFAVTSRAHETGLVGHLANLILSAAGADVALTPEGLLLNTGVRTIVHSLTWEMFGALMLVLLIVGSVPLLAIRRARWHAFPILALGLIVFAEVRLAVLVLMAATSERLEIFWSRPVMLLSFLPVVLLASALLRVPAEAPAASAARPRVDVRSRQLWVAAALIAVAAVAIIGAWAFDFPGPLKGGRVIMEEGHSDWAWTTDEYDTEWYGERSGYNYYNLYGYLDLHYEMTRNEEPITDDVLSECDVLIVKMPTTAYEPEEIDSIVPFVDRGGGVWLIGDHTNVFGTSVNINPLAERFGMRFNHDATYELLQGSLSEYARPRILPHPIVQHLPGRFLFGTSSSMWVAPDVTGVIVGQGLKALDADYSQDNFFPEVSTSAEQRFGSFVQGAAVKYGQGRVAAFADSTVFSNFWMFMPGKPELALGYVDWLNHSDRIPYARVLLLGLAAAFILGAITHARRAGRVALLLAVAAGLLVGVPAGIHGWGAANRSAYPAPQPVEEFVSISFEREYSVYDLPATFEGFLAEWDSTLQTFYVWTQRLGYYPAVKESLADALADGDVVVIVNPVEPPSEAAVAALGDFVNAGGRLLVMDRASNSQSSSEAFLEPFGLRIDEVAPADGSLYDLENDKTTAAATEGAGTVSGGTPLVSTDTGEVIGAYARSGSGVVVAFADSGLFFNISLGDISGIPDARQRDIGELEFALMRFLAEDVPMNTGR